jgi:transposase-like protein
LLAEAVGRDAVERHLEQLRVEWQPTSPTEEVLVLELARHGAALELVEQVEAAVLRCGMRGAGSILPPAELDVEESSDTLLVGAVTTEAIDRLTRYRRAHEKGWYNALLRLREAKARRRSAGISVPLSPVPLLSSEEQCVAYLTTRARRANRLCPRCGWRRGYWLAGRQRWQCQRCGGQFGIRAGTVMESSRLPLKVWMIAIQTILDNDAISLRALGAAVGIRRLRTLRRLAWKVRRALDSERASELLAGLDQFARPYRNS